MCTHGAIASQWKSSLPFSWFKYLIASYWVFLNHASEHPIAIANYACKWPIANSQNFMLRKIVT